jgi:hypothetical protein
MMYAPLVGVLYVLAFLPLPTAPHAAPPRPPLPAGLATAPSGPRCMGTSALRLRGGVRRVPRSPGTAGPGSTPERQARCGAEQGSVPGGSARTARGDVGSAQQRSGPGRHQLNPSHNRRQGRGGNGNGQPGHDRRHVPRGRGDEGGGGGGGGGGPQRKERRGTAAALDEGDGESESEDVNAAPKTLAGIYNVCVCVCVCVYNIYIYSYVCVCVCVRVCVSYYKYIHAWVCICDM